jgi:cytochrome c-type biogenesis protein CcmF
MPQFGSFTLLLALGLTAYCFVVGALSLWQLTRPSTQRISGPERLLETSRRAGISSFVALTGAALALVWCAFTNNFSVAYILEHSNRALPGPYKFAALWSGQEGSLLLWAWLLATYGFVVRIRQRVDVRLSAYASVILSGIQLFFVILINFAANPFAMLQGAVPADGNGLNPLLQYPEMVIHPPMLYLGYVGFSVPFAFALGALMMRYPGEKWIHITRRWTMITWLFLTCGIFLGAHWAYSVLGWGGYWGWDPVENASLMPWLTGTAFLHSVMMQEKRGMMKTWNVWLIFSTFLLTLLGTLLTRAGLVQSVHAFAQSSIGDWFVGFMIVVFAVCLITYLYQRDHLRVDHRLESLASRESSFLFNNLLLLAACFTILWGTLFPIISEYAQGHKVTVGAPYYNRVGLPIGLFLLFLTGIGPLLAWRSTSLRSIRRNLLLPLLAGVATAIILIAAGIRPWDDVSNLYSLVAFSLGAMVIVTISSEFLRGAAVLQRQTGRNIFSSIVLLTRRNTRRYGGYIVHFGIVLIFVGIAGAAFNQVNEQELGLHQAMFIGPYKLVNQSYTQDDNLNYRSEFALLDVYKGNKKIARLAPEQRFYYASQQTETMVANNSNLERDLYVIYAGKNPDSGQPIIKALINPLVNWIWIGVLVVVAGTGLALIPSLRSSGSRPQLPASDEAAFQARNETVAVGGD